jgi:radical SAM family RiPP maturation amino acid epimerase
MYRELLSGWRQATFAMRAASTASPSNVKMAAWRRRQIKRCDAELGAAKNAHLVNVPVAFELNRGCSVGCWFCSVAAPKLTEKAVYADIGPLWRDVLSVVREVVGDAARWGFCYWATDPLDNPDYEQFCLDFTEILGRFPQTTTAIALQDVERTRRVLKLSREHGCELNRFSILSMSMLEKVLQSFTPEELLHVSLLPLNKEAGFAKSRSGRARQGRVPRGHLVSDEAHASTTSCISGFLFNMVDRRVQLVTPCNASDRWPLGHWVIDEFYFENGDDLRRKMLACIETCMPIALPSVRVVRFHRALALSMGGQSIHLESSWTTYELHSLPFAKEFSERIGQGARTAGELALEMEACYGLPLAHTLYRCQQLFELGLLDEEPPARTLSVATQVDVEPDHDATVL